MKSLAHQLSNYAEYHRDRRNVATHFIGVPMIVFAVVVLLSRVGFEIGGWRLTPATLAVAATLYYYLRLDRRLGLVMAVLLGLALWGADVFARGSSIEWLGAGVGLFVIGWLFQFVGHIFEGRKPAFFDDVMGLLIGPLFVVVEMGLLVGAWPRYRRFMTPSPHN